MFRVRFETLFLVVEASSDLIRSICHVLSAVIPSASTPGLEVRDVADTCWVSVESEAASRANSSACSSCHVLMGDTLARFGGMFGATVHRVAKAAEPRLSLVYEMRPEPEHGHGSTVH